jgi:hypothetical protein
MAKAIDAFPNMKQKAIDAFASIIKKAINDL